VWRAVDVPDRGVLPSATFEAQVVHRGQSNVIPITAGEPLLASLERAGIAVESACRSGECSACRAKVTQGNVYQPPKTGLRESDRTHGYVHMCVCYPLSDVSLKL
jgi:ferredoxin